MLFTETKLHYLEREEREAQSLETRFDFYSTKQKNRNKMQKMLKEFSLQEQDKEWQ